jgi:AcrR family transcriptional regulator
LTPDTREKILESAEKLFVANGFDGTSLRAITALAEVNLAAVNYHFGSKQQLLEAVLRHRIGPVNAERVRRLDAIEQECRPEGITLEQYLDAFIRPAAEMLHGVGRQHTIGLLALMFADRLRPSFFQETFGDLMQRFARIRDVLPHLDGEESAWRFHFMIGAMIHAAAHQIEDRDPRLKPQDNDAFVRMIVTWAAAGFRAEATLHRDAVALPKEKTS